MNATAIEGRDRSVTIATEGARLEGVLGVPAEAKAAVLFGHGGSCGRYCPGNLAIVRALQAGGFATLLVDLLAEREMEEYGKLFDMNLLADRILAARAWLREAPETQPLGAGYFGLGTGAAAVIAAAARQPGLVGAVVAGGGRLDLVGPFLPLVTSPTLLIAGGHDLLAAELSKGALNRLRATKDLVIVPGATHPFEEPATMAGVTSKAVDWFRRYL